MKKINPLTTIRPCTICKLIKPYSEFYWDKRFNIPFSRCKECYNNKCKKYRHTEEGKETYKAWRQSERGKQVHALAQETRFKKNPEKRRAVWFVNNAIRDKRLLKKPCALCDEIKVEAHHWSYLEEHWLDVIWLCKLHHSKVTFYK